VLLAGGFIHSIFWANSCQRFCTSYIFGLGANQNQSSMSGHKELQNFMSAKKLQVTWAVTISKLPLEMCFFSSTLKEPPFSNFCKDLLFISQKAKVVLTKSRYPKKPKSLSFLKVLGHLMSLEQPTKIKSNLFLQKALHYNKKSCCYCSNYICINCSSKNFGLEPFRLLERLKYLKKLFSDDIILFHQKLYHLCKILQSLLKQTVCEWYLIIYPHSIFIILLNLYSTEKISFNTFYPIKDHLISFNIPLNII